MKKQMFLLIIQSVLCVLCVLVMSVLVVRLFLEGQAYKLDGHPSEWIYTREKAGNLLLTCLPLFLLSVGATVVSAVMGVKSSSKPQKDAEITRDLTIRCIKEPSVEMLAERSIQKRFHIGGWCGFAACMVPIVLYCVNPAHFDRSDAEGLETVIGAMVLHTAPWACLAIAVLSVCLLLRDKSLERETNLAKNCKKEAISSKTAASSGKTVMIVRFAVLAAAMLCIILGMFNGSMRDVLYKAINICTECIGLG